jgi:hypothetical protein
MNRLGYLTALVAAALCLLAIPVASASAAPSPWWQVLTGSRPTNLWEPTDNVQEIQTEIGEFPPFGEGAGAKIEVGGKAVGCLGTANFLGTAICESEFGFPPDETAAQLEATLESAYGTSAVAVSGGPVGVLTEFPGVGAASVKLLNAGGSGSLVLTITNLGDAAMDATGTPLTIVDELPDGVEATGVEAFAGVQGSAGPVECTVEANDLVSCTFAEVLPSYEAIEIEIQASVIGAPPVAGAPGRVTVSGGNAADASAVQAVKISPEQTPFGLEQFSAQAEEEGGGLSAQAGRHPFQLTTTIQLNSGPVVAGATRRDAKVEQPALPRNVRFELPAGLVGNATSVARCPTKNFFALRVEENCPANTAIGVASVTVVEPQSLGLVRIPVPVFNLPPAAGEPARFGFIVAAAPVVSVNNATQLAQFLSSTVSLWGAPGDPRHDSSRGWYCVDTESGTPCERPADLAETAFLRQPVSCATPLDFKAEIEPWNVPLGSVIERGGFFGGSLSGCNQIPFDPTIAAAPTTRFTDSSSGLDFRLQMPNSGLLAKDAVAEGQAKKVEVALPKGMTINPAEGEGLVGCSPADLARETASSEPGAGCPETSKIGDVQVSTPLLEEEASGSLYVATPHDNPFDSLIALYLVARIPDRGILVKQAGRVQADPASGQLTTTFDDLPQLPFSTFKLHFREGDRAPLVTPPGCGTYDVVARFTPWSAADPDHPTPGEIVTRTSSFRVERGVGGGSCPSGDSRPLHPGLNAGTVNNAAGKYSPFYLRLTRNDGEQEFTNFSIKLPPGVTGKLAGIPFCPDQAIAAATARTGVNGGQEELESPSCPASSRVGRTLVGAGVGGSLTYVPGKVYLAGPYHGSALSVVAITAAKVGPFDLGTVVIRESLKVNPETAQVFVDATGSDPIPHIIQGIPVHARDIRVYADRPDFVLNPTSCARTSTAATVLGSGADFASALDDQPVAVTVPFQAASCASLGFKPKLSLSLKGGTKRSDTPRLKAVVTARKGDANIGAAEVTLPRSEFLEQAHIRTVCTRVQFAAGGGNGEKCPAASIYGRAKAVTPLLDEPLAGPVYLRSSSHKLPDLVVALHSGKIDINLAGRIDSVENGRIRNTFEAVPDAPVTKFTLEMQGGRKGLLVNSTNLCKRKHRAIAAFSGQNGKRYEINPELKVRCGGKAKKHRANR